VPAGHPHIDRLARVSFAAEAPVRRLVGSGRLNPLPHAGAISVVLFLVVVVTGVYITLFFEFGFDASYRSVERLTAHPIQRFMRSAHRYSSAALVLTTLVHAWRIFVAARFGGPRRWRWLTGLSALVIVWIAGVTGYWLLWDERAQLVNEATVSVLGVLRAGTTFVSGIVVGGGSGWQVLLAIWFAHLVTTAVIGWLLWRHLRRTRLPWLPPRLWTGLMLAALVVVSVALPAELLAHADPGAIVGSVPLDPFFLFLLPGLGAIPGPLVLVGFFAVAGFVAGLPWLLGRRRTQVVSIDTEACTGCELCVIDCPYEALTMVEWGERAVAEVDPAACVACGICIGSCVFDAIELPGATIPDDLDVAGRAVVVVCDRHRRLGRADDDAQIVAVRCAGVVSPTAVTRLVAGGALSVQLVGCPPGDCAYGVGNKLAEERLEGERKPRVPARSARATTRDFVAPTALAHALAAPGTHLSADPGDIPDRRWRAAAAAAVVLASILLVGLATTVLFAADRPESGVLVVVYHQPGAVIAATGTPSGAAGTATVLRTTIGDGEPVERVIGSGGLASAYVSLPTAPGETYVRVELREGADTTIVRDGVATLEAGRQLVVAVADERNVDAEAGEAVFSSSRAGCTVCHSVEPGEVRVGPSLAGLAARARERVAGMSAEDYIRQSILDPDAYVVVDFRPGQMLDEYDETLTAEELEGLVAYLLTLDG
jgi:ferredoxin/cytochrome c551/c552